MLFWHLGATLWLFRWIFRDPKVDVRFLLAGAILPDVADLLIGTGIMGGSLAIGELWFHTLLAPTLYMATRAAFHQTGPPTSLLHGARRRMVVPYPPRWPVDRSRSSVLAVLRLGDAGGHPTVLAAGLGAGDE